MKKKKKCTESLYHDIEVALNIIYQRLLGVEAKTVSVAVWSELGVASVATRINPAALKFRNNILSLENSDFLVRRVYDGLMNDSKGRGSSRNGALFLENLALEGASLKAKLAEQEANAVAPTPAQKEPSPVENEFSPAQERVGSELPTAGD